MKKINYQMKRNENYHFEKSGAYKYYTPFALHSTNDDNNDIKSIRTLYMIIMNYLTTVTSVNYP